MSMILRLLVLCGLLSLSAPALALTCSFTVSNVNFGNVDTSSSANPLASATAPVSISCSRALIELTGGTVTACINIGEGSGGFNNSGGVRFLKNGSSTLSYNLFKNAAATNIWGSTSGVFVSAGPKKFLLNVRALGGSATANDTIYGRVPGGQAAVNSGAYLSSFTGLEARLRYGNGDIPCTSAQGSATTSFTVSATVAANCQITAQDLSFGSASSLSVNLDANSAISVNCTNTTPYSLTIDNGANFSGTRRMRNIASNTYIDYGLFQDAARGVPWGSFNGTGTGSASNITVYGRVPPQPANSPGNYVDTVAAVITF